ncbi:MAG: XisI protein [Armatimonadetes bacterium]|nr:XisI protein [Armatimonadota bacterium]
MDRLDIQQNAVRELMQEWLDWVRPRRSYGVELIIDEAKHRFILMSDGWMGHTRLYGPLIDIALRDGKIWIHEDNTEEGIPDTLLSKGILAEEIVLGWQPEYKRELTGFAVA